MSAETPSFEDQSNQSGLIQSASEMAKAVGQDPKVRKTLRKMGEHGLQGAGITKKGRFSRKTTIQEAGVRQAISDPKQALQGAAERTRRDIHKLGFYAGFTAVKHIFGKSPAGGKENLAMSPNFSASNQTESAVSSTNNATAETAAPNLGATYEAQGIAVPNEVTFSNGENLPASASEYTASTYSDSTAGAGHEQTVFSPGLTATQLPVEKAPLPHANTTAR